MLRKILAILLFIILVLLFFTNSPSIRFASSVKLISEINDNSVKIYDNKFKLNSVLYWNRLNRITKVSKDYKQNDIIFENSYFYNGKDFLLSKEGESIYIIDKKNEEKKFLINGAVALVNKDSNLFAVLQKNGLDIIFYQFIPLERRPIELKKEVFSSFYTFYKITRNSFYFSLMNGSCYVYNPFDLISSENIIKDDVFIQCITANSSSTNYLIISGYNPQYLSQLNKDGKIIYQYKLDKSYPSVFMHLLDNSILILKNSESLDIYDLNFSKDKSINLRNSIKINGDILDIIEFYSATIFIISDGKQFYLLFYDFNKNKFHKKNWRYPVYQIDIIDTNGIFYLYNQNMMWILQVNME